MSLADAVAKTLAEELSLLEATQDGQKAPEAEAIPLNIAIDEELDQPAEQLELTPVKLADFCPQCGQATFVFQEGCKKCHSCGYSAC